MSHCILIFTRNPELGKVKSRLAKGVGKQNALTIYKLLLQHTHNVVHQVDYHKWVGYSVAVRTEDMWENDAFHKFQQEGEDLGARMQHAFQKAFAAGHDKVLIIGSDLYDLRSHHITAAFEALETSDVVIGPAQDGGYYLLAMKKAIPALFKNKNWGTESVLSDTLKDLKEQQVHHLETLNDIDFAEDLKPYPEFAQYLK